MPWPWGPTRSNSTIPADTTPTTPTTPTTSATTTTTTTTSTTESQNAGKKPTRDDLADLELQEFLSQFSDPSTASSSSSSPAVNQECTPTTASPRGKEDREAGQESALFPTTMNCLHAFDQVWYCYSLGGQFLNVYRYGTLRDCSAQSADWRFCMRTKTSSGASKQAMIMQHYREKAAQLKKGPSSEDIWKVRTTPIEDGAFTGWAKSE